MDAFGRLMVGAISTYHHGTITTAYTPVRSTGFRSLISDDTYSNYTTSNTTFATAVENLFENVIMSLLSATTSPSTFKPPTLFLIRSEDPLIRALA